MRRWMTVAVAAGAALVGVCVAPVAPRAWAAGWSIQVTPDPPGADTSVLDGIACPAARACLAVGYTSTGMGAAMPLAERWSGHAWSLERVPMPRAATSALLFAVSCPSRRSCTAVGSETTRSATTVPLAERYNGSRWRIVTVPRAAGLHRARVSYLGAVSCPTVAACAAVGFAGSPLGSAGRAVVASWAGGRWSAAAAPAPPGTAAGFLSGVSCPAPGVCTAVGDRVGRRGTVSTMALRLGTGGWSIQPAPTPEGASSVQLVSVSCATVTECVAAGFFQVSGIDIMLAERWDGTRWVVQHTRYPRGARSVQFAAVSCAAARACAAVGSDNDPAGADVTLAERWNGRRWAIERTPRVGGAATDTLGGVACPSASRCEAVGGFVNTAGVQATLAERAAVLARRAASARRRATAAPPDPNLVRAQLRAARLLAQAPLPSGATSQPSDPSVGGELAHPGSATGGQLVEATGYWTVPASVGAVESFATHHRPPGSRVGSTGSSTGPDGGVWTESFSFPGAPGALAGEALVVTVAAASGGRAAVRVDAEVLWRPTWEQIPVSTRRASVRVGGGAALTLTGDRVARLVRLVDRLAAAPPGVFSCPFEAGETFSVAFQAAAGTPVARLSIAQGGCGFIGVSIDGRTAPALADGDQVVALLWSLHGLTRCTAGQLRARVGPMSRTPGTRSIQLTLTDASRLPCTLQGEPSLTFRDAGGHRLAIAVRRERQAASPATAGRGVPLDFQVQWSVHRGRCSGPVVASLAVGLPGTRATLTIPAPPGLRIAGCGGSVQVSPLFAQ